MNIQKIKLMATAAFMLFLSTIVSAQTTEFTFQGSLKDNSAAATGNYDFEFVLFDALSAGSQIGSVLTRSGITVTNGIFSVKLDFGANYPGASRFLEIHVRQTAGGGFTPLTPRQPVSSSPYSVKSLNADIATNTAQLGGVAANQYVVTTDPRMADARQPTAGSTSYVQNQNAAPQSLSNFNISGSGTANVFNAATQYNIGGSRVLSTAGFDNLFAGDSAGQSNTGISNSFFGSGAGQANTNGSDNSFVGFWAGRNNTTGDSNSFFGTGAGFSNTTSSGNAFFGNDAGGSNLTGTNNAFFGKDAGRMNNSNNNSFFGGLAGDANTSGFNNAFFGNGAGGANTMGGDNVFVGGVAGTGNTGGGSNTFVGAGSGSTNMTGNNNTIIGSNANVGGLGLSFASAIGSNASVSTSNTVALGRSNGADVVVIYGLGVAGATPLCRNLSNQISTCSSSLRYKTNIGQFSQGMSFVNKLRPISFEWKDGGTKDVGFGAEEIAKIDPRFVTYNDKGEVEGVKYDRIGVVLVNAVKEQQTLIESQQKKIETLEDQVKALTLLVCMNNKNAEICKAR